MQSKLAIGLDFGSDSLRAIAVDTQGRVQGSAMSLYRRWSEGLFCDPQSNQYRQHPLDYLESLEEVLLELLAQVDRNAVVGMALDSTASTPCAVNREGLPLALLPEFDDNPNAMFLLWKDAKADPVHKAFEPLRHTKGGGHERTQRDTKTH